MINIDSVKFVHQHKKSSSLGDCLPVGLSFALPLAGHAVAVAPHVGGRTLALAVIPDGLEGAGLALVQALEALSALNSGKVDKDVLGSIIGADEAESLLGVEKLDGSRRHFLFLEIDRR